MGVPKKAPRLVCLGSPTTEHKPQESQLNATRKTPTEDAPITQITSQMQQTADTGPRQSPPKDPEKATEPENKPKNGKS